MSEKLTEELVRIHGKGMCPTCGYPQAGEGSEICSYPHGLVPVAPVNPDGFWTWEKPAGRQAFDQNGGDA